MKVKLVHPGATLRGIVLRHLKFTVAEAARRLGVSRSALSAVVNEQAQISTNLAMRLEKAGIETARFWLGLQMNYDLQQAEKQKRRMKVIPLSTVQTNLALEN